MTFASRISIDDRLFFERIVTRLVVIGAVAGTFFVPLAHELATWPLVLGSVVSVALFGAGPLRGRDDTLELRTRVLGFLVAGFAGFWFSAVPVAVLAVGGLAGLSLAPTERRLFGAVGGLVGVGWALWLMPELDRLFAGAHPGVRMVGATVAGSAVFALGLLVSHLRLHVDALSARLERRGSESGRWLNRTWVRCHRALEQAPARLRGELIHLLDSGVREAERMLSTLETLERRLSAANPADATAQLTQLKVDIAESKDSTTRERLQGAAASLSDGLEHFQTLERRRERFAAELKLKLATLERAALGLETAQGEPEELRSVVLRLTAP